MAYAILDKTEEMLNRIEASLVANIDKAQAPDTDINESTYDQLKEKAGQLKIAYEQDKQALLETLTPEQHSLREAHKAIRRADKACDYDETTYDPERERAARKAFVDSLSDDQKTLYKKTQDSRRAFKEADDAAFNCLQQILLYGARGLSPSIARDISEVMFPENNSRAENCTIHSLLQLLPILPGLMEGNATASDKEDKWMPALSIPKLELPEVNNQQEELIGLKLKGNALDKSEITALLHSYRQAISRLREILPERNKGWEKVSTDRSAGYRYISHESSALIDPVYTIADSLAACDEQLNPDRKLLYQTPEGEIMSYQKLKALQREYQKGTKEVIILTGKAAQRVLVDELGLNLKDIPEATSTRWR